MGYFEEAIKVYQSIMQKFAHSETEVAKAKNAVIQALTNGAYQDYVQQKFATAEWEVSF